jgi:asparagine synthase (glutamine-hydrolysing)
VCGIAGIVDLAGRRPAPAETLAAMAAAIVHRGPDEDGFLDRDGLGLASRRLSIVGLADGRQPIPNEDRTVWVVFNGELFDYPEERAALEAKGHRFATHTDTELLPHLWEEYGERMFDRVRGQFAFALYDTHNRQLILARDRFGICPLFYTVRKEADGGETLLFASEMKALFASGLVEPKPDLFGLNGIFTYFAMPGPRTCFEGIRSLLPGEYLRVPLGPGSRGDQLSPRFYWQMDFPDRGDEDPGSDARKTIDGFEEVLLAAVQRRLRADVPVVSYLSGGVDSSQVVAMASKALGRPIPTFTISIQAKDLNEENEALVVARHVGSKPAIVPFGGPEVLATYPELIHAAEMPVVDTACAALLALARRVRHDGYKVALTGEGSDEFMAGYPWFKLNRAFSPLDGIPGIPLGQLMRRGFLRLNGLPRFPWPVVHRTAASVGGYNAWLDVYGLMSLSRLMFFSPAMKEAVGDHVPYDDLKLDLPRMARWHPLNRALALGAKVMLGGMLLLSKGDRVAMNSSVETRYPFLDEAVFAFLAKLSPRWKLRGLTDKYILRKMAERWLPKEIAWRRKAMFRAPMDTFHLEGAPAFFEQLLSAEALRKTGYFDPAAVRHWRTALLHMRHGSYPRTAVEMGLMGVTATQLWHQTFIDSTLAEVPEKAHGLQPVGLGGAA